MISSTPKNNVKPTATSVYIMPSIRPFMTYWVRSPTSIFSDPVRAAMAERDGTPMPRPARSLFLSGKLALASGVFAVVPLHELAVLDHVFSDQSHSVLTMVVERDLADDGVTVFYVGQFLDDLLTIRTDLFDRVEDQIHGGIRESAVSFRWIVVFLRGIILQEEFPARQLLRRRAFTEGERAFGKRSEPLDKSIRHDARGAIEHSLDTELVHLRADAHADWCKPAEIDHLWIECLDLRKFGGEVLLVRGDAGRDRKS